jgi:hypothetical protein
MLKRIFFVVLLALIAAKPLAQNTQKLIISEFLASNSAGIKDEDAAYSDWIEIYNPSNVAINLNGWTITDDSNKLRKWTFPTISIGAGEYLVIFASGKDRVVAGKELHTNFSLSKDGEYLGLMEPSGAIAYAYSPTYPLQTTDVSYGDYQGNHVFFYTPSPGAANSIVQQAAVPVFSRERAYYEQAFQLILSTTDADTKIHYTLDGNVPTEASPLYSSTLNINKTTVLSAVGIKNGIRSKVVTNSYFFINDIITQGANPVGYPDRWGVLGGNVKYDKYAVGERAPAHYAMDADVINNSAYASHLKNAFLSIPTMSLVTNASHLFSADVDANTGGIYIHTGARIGDGWERPTSVEYFDPQTQQHFQENCGVRMHGAASREPEKTAKHSFRLYFKSQYGDSKLRYKLFDENTAVDKFDHLVLRAGFGYSWMHWSLNDRRYSQYGIDSFSKRTQRAMGQPAAHDKNVHLFINGMYWGVYNITERLSEKFMEAYFGGDELDYDVLNHNGLASGTRTVFDRLVSLAQVGDLATIEAENLLDVDNYIDYLLINFYLGNVDWGDNNWYAARSRTQPEKGFRFFCWDTENCFYSGLNFNTMTSAWRFKGPLRRILFGADDTKFDAGLSQNAEFRMRFADRVQKHFFNNGALSPEAAAKLYADISNEMDPAIILESARWGAYRRKTLPGDGTSPLYTRNDHWLPQKEHILNNHLPGRTQVLYDQLWGLSLVPNIEAPILSVSSINQQSKLSMAAESGVLIYYNANGIDPRTSYSGSIQNTAQIYTTPIATLHEGRIVARAYKNGEWSALSEMLFVNGNVSAVRDVNILPTMQAYYAQRSIFVTSEIHQDIVLEIYAIDGRMLCKQQIHMQQGTNKVELPSLNKGMYIYRISNGESNYSAKFLYQ